MLSNAAGKDNCIQAAQQPVEGADGLAHTPGKDFEREPGVGVSGRSSLAHTPHIIGQTGERHHPSLMIQQRFDRVHGGHAIPLRLPQQV